MTRLGLVVASETPRIDLINLLSPRNFVFAPSSLESRSGGDIRLDFF